MASHEYDVRVAQLFSSQQPTTTKASQKRVAYSIAEQLRAELLSQKTSRLDKLTESVLEVTNNYDNHNISSVRHICGWTISKLMKIKRKTALRHMYNEKLKAETAALKDDLEILESLTTRERDGADKTAAETLRKEYVTGALKLPTSIVTDLFLDVDKKLVSYERSDSCKAKGGKMYSHILDLLYQDERLNSKWREVSGSENLLLFHSMLDKYTVLSASHFIRRAKEAAKVTAKKAHRTQQQIPSKRHKK